MSRIPQFQIRRYSKEAVTHTHSQHQIVLALNGKLEMDIAGCNGWASSKQAAVVASGTPHSFAAAPNDTFLVADVFIGSVDPNQSFWEHSACQPFVILDAGCKGLIDFLGYQASQNHLNDRCNYHAGELLLASLQARVGIRPRIPAAIQRAQQFIEARFDQPITLEDIAAHCGKSVGRLHALFRDALNTTPGRYLLECRIQWAMDMLLKTDFSVAQIAQAAGFSDQAAFARAFRRINNCSPSDFRNRKSAVSA